tara:strand:+ start:144 stop:365 length:222 start_codon:yes stop_codon:yes gene_type:complete
MAEFGDIVDGTFILSPEQIESRKYGFSDIKASGIPTIYHAGDVVNLPYATGETSTIEAIGLAWSAFSSGIRPA